MEIIDRDYIPFDYITTSNTDATGVRRHEVSEPIYSYSTLSNTWGGNAHFQYLNSERNAASTSTTSDGVLRLLSRALELAFKTTGRPEELDENEWFRILTDSK